MAGVTTRATKGSPLSATEHDDNLETIINLHKSATEPSPTYACMLWADTATTLLKQRNTADSAWTTLGTLDTAGSFGGGSSDVVDDTTPQLGGNLDMQAHSIEGVTATEMGYLDGVTSDIQTQLDTKLSSVADNSVTLAKMAGGTDGNLITYDASGDPAYVTTGTSGQVLTSGGTGVAPTFQTAASGGKVLQVVQSLYGGQKSSTSTTWSDTGLTASITPSSTSSKILITVHQNGVDLRGGNSYIGLRIDKDGSTLKDFAALAARNNSASVDNAIGTVSMCYLDSPATTSSITYKTEFQNAGGATGIAYVQVVDLADNSTITLMEIGA